jgi:penicillin-binding protein 2
VRALVSYPSYDGNSFSQPALRTQAAEAILDERQLLFNRAVSGTYPPGSTIKPFIAAGALAEDIITPGTTYQSTGGLSIGIWNFPDWKAGGHGTTNVTKAIAESVNTFFYLITGGDETRTGLGVKRTTNYLAKFGWGEPTGIDIPSEAAGFLPSPEWKEEVKDEHWYIGDTYHLAIGQGDVLVTPIQLAVSTASVANGGTVHEPFLVRALTWPDKDPKDRPTTARHTTVPAADIATVRAGMRETVTAGSGRSLSLLATPVAGKTGTSQISGTDETHAWFTSFGPYAEPELVVTVLVERGGAGDKVAAPIARDIWQWWGDNRAGS